MTSLLHKYNFQPYYSRSFDLLYIYILIRFSVRNIYLYISYMYISYASAAMNILCWWATINDVN